MRKFYFILIFCFASTCLSQDMIQLEKPNILIILTDQQNFFTMKAYGNEKIQTPALNKLASKSFVFKNAYVTQPVCAPSRASILTGLYPHLHGVVSNEVPLSKDILTFPEMIEDSQYRTAYIGKWHLGDEIFLQRGFDTWVSMEDGYEAEYSPENDRSKRSDYHYWLTQKAYKPDKVQKNRFSRKFAASLPIEHCKPAFLQSKAIEFLDSLGESPFIMYLSFLEPHKPYTGPLDSLYHPNEIILPPNFHDTLGSFDPLRYRDKAQDDKKKYGSEQGYKNLIARYWGLVSQVDRSIKAVLNKLEMLGLDEQTIVVFTSDHGSMMGAHGLVSKDVMYEESVRVPFLLKIPNLSEEGVVIHEPVSLIDLVPTLLDLLDKPLSDHLNGESLLPFLRKEEEHEREIYIQWPNIRTIITDDGWKMALIKGDRSLLFNLNEDPYERQNLFYNSKYKGHISDLARKIQHWQKATKDSYQINTDY